MLKIAYKTGKNIYTEKKCTNFVYQMAKKIIKRERKIIIKKNTITIKLKILNTRCTQQQNRYYHPYIYKTLWQEIRDKRERGHKIMRIGQARTQIIQILGTHKTNIQQEKIIKEK